MESQPLISVIVPNFNNGDHIKHTINSILAQSYHNIEVVAVDDGSSDHSCSEVLSLDNSRVRLLAQPDNNGVSHCRNIGIQSAMGEYISTLDSDDLYINPDKLRNELDVLTRHQQQSNSDVIAFSNTALINQDNEITGVIGGTLQKIEEGNLYRQFWQRSAFIPRDYLIRKQLLVDIGLYDTELRMYEDLDLKIRLADRHEYFYSGHIGTGYRRQNGLSRSPKPVHTEWLTKIRQKHKRLKAMERDKSGTMLSD